MTETSSDLARVVAAAVPGAELLEATALKPDAGGGGDGGGDGDGGGKTAKTIGYGAPLKVRIRLPGGAIQTLVLHTATPNPFGHDRRSDRAADMLLAYDTFGDLPRHVRALDVGAISRDGKRLISLGGAGEFYVLSEWAEGHVYADELRAIRSRGALVPEDLEHCRTLARYLAELHRAPLHDPVAYTRAIRDLLGSGEGIFGIVDGYPEQPPGAAASKTRLHAIEKSCLEWRFKLRGQSERLRRTHGDFHPFNILFDGPELRLLDTSRGSRGDPADDVACLAINYVFFALDEPAAWFNAFRQLWLELWNTYRAERPDAELDGALAPFFAWRGLVLANPVWYGAVSERGRDRLLGFIEAALSQERFDPALADRVFA